jgi:hypothetical protein
VDGTPGVTAAEQILSERIENRTDRIGPKPLQVVGPLKKRVEHACPPGKEIEIPGRASKLCGVLSAG